MSRILQGAQIIEFVLGGLIYEVVAGPKLDLLFSSSGLNISPGFSGTFTMRFDPTIPWVIGINGWVLFAFIVLVRAVPPLPCSDRTQSWQGGARLTRGEGPVA